MSDSRFFRFSYTKKAEFPMHCGLRWGSQTAKVPKSNLAGPCNQPRPTRASRALCARKNPENPKRVWKASPAPGTPGPRVPKDCAPEFQESPRRVQNLAFGLFSESFRTLMRPPKCTHSRLRESWAPSDSFRTLFGLSWGSWPEEPQKPLCGAGPIANLTRN